VLKVSIGVRSFIDPSPDGFSRGAGLKTGKDMNITVEYWHWLVFGMLLIMVEIFVPSFTIFWFGLGGLVVAGLLLISTTIIFTWQLFIWAIASCVFTFLWFKFIRPRMADRTRAGLSREAAIGETGHVIRKPEQERRGMVRFATPLLGSDEWPFICDTDVGVGDLATSANSKVVLMPAEIPKAIRGILGRS
jgi:inner membrane protein